MQANDVRVLKSAAIPTLAVGLVAVIVSLWAAGAKGALGAVIGALLVAAFFTISFAVVAWAGRVSPMAMFAAAVVGYAVKIIVIGLLLRAFEGAEAWNFTAFAWTVIGGTLAWTAGEVRAFMRLKLLYVEPVAQVPGQGKP